MHEIESVNFQSGVKEVIFKHRELPENTSTFLKLLDEDCNGKAFYKLNNDHVNGATNSVIVSVNFIDNGTEHKYAKLIIELAVGKVNVCVGIDKDRLPLEWINAVDNITKPLFDFLCQYFQKGFEFLKKDKDFDFTLTRICQLCDASGLLFVFTNYNAELDIDIQVTAILKYV